MESVRDFPFLFPSFSAGVKWEKVALWVGGTVWLWPRFQCLLATGHWHPLFYTCVGAPFTIQFQIHTGLSVSSLSHHQDSAASAQALHPSLAQKHRFPHPEAPDTTWAHLPASLCALAASADGLLHEACFPSVLSPPLPFICWAKPKPWLFWKVLSLLKKKKSIRNSNDFLLSFFG